MVMYLAKAFRNNETTPYFSKKFTSQEEAAAYMVGVVLKELGDGGGENGGKGGLYNCSLDIFYSLKTNGNYYYADCKFIIEKEDIAYVVHIGPYGKSDIVETNIFRHKDNMQDWVDKTTEELVNDGVVPCGDVLPWNYHTVNLANIIS